MAANETPSAYVVLARKWRPSQFADIVGQGHIVRTLMNAIRGNRLHQAYLFTGSRGIGKTSIARIFGKAIRCEQVKDTKDWLTSCDQCSSCKEITATTSVDVMEIDGASNNGVEAVREIRENAKFLPSVGKTKIYIVDEVHMLTTAAFNALLKTLEEPPPHVIFIFATTEPHKIPATILSRCQRFDFRRVNISQIQTRLEQVIQAEKISAEAGTLALIAKAAEGSMRDALSLLDQVIAFSGKKLTAESVRDSIGLIQSQVLLDILTAVLNRKPLDAIQCVDSVYQTGHDLRVLARNLVELLYGVILVKIGSPPSSEFSEIEWTNLQSVAEYRSLEELELIFQVLHQGIEWIARSPQPKTVLNILLIKCAAAESLVEMSQVPNANAPTARPEVKIENKIETKVQIKTEAITTSSPKDGKWESFIVFVRKTRPLLASILEHGSNTKTPKEAGQALTILFNKEETYDKQLQNRVYTEQLGTLAKEFYGFAVRVQIETGDSSESIAAQKEKVIKDKEMSAKARVEAHPILKEAQALFGSELRNIETRNEPHA
jgi:DNA polymerase-3 subunit gamma/tau